MKTKARWLDPDDPIGKQDGTTRSNRAQKIKENLEEDIKETRRRIEEGEWSEIEHAEWLRQNNYDAVYTVERGFLNISVLDPSQVWVQCIHWNTGKMDGVCGDPQDIEAMEILENTKVTRDWPPTDRLEHKAMQVMILEKRDMTVDIDKVRLEGRDRYFVMAKLRGDNKEYDTQNFSSYDGALKFKQDIYDGNYLVSWDKI